MKNPYPRTKLASLLLAMGLGLAPIALAVDPPPDGGYANGNTAEGQDALFGLTTGSYNTAVGFETLYNTATALGNTAIGYHVLKNTTTGGFNTAIGISALYYNTIGSSNTAAGTLALGQNTTGNFNTATGYYALDNNTTGGSNTATGYQALLGNTTGSNNTAFGQNTLLKVAAGASNIAVGTSAGSSLTSGSNNIYLAALGASAESNVMRLGRNGVQKNTYVAGISGATVAGGVGVIVDSAGHLGTVVSSERFKDGIKPMDTASEAILSLQPVTFHYKKDLDPQAIRQFGLVAEQVEKVNPDLVARDEQGKPYTVRYEAVNAMLLNEFIKEHRKTEEQGREIGDLKATVSELKSQLSAVTTTLKEQATEPRR